MRSERSRRAVCLLCINDQPSISKAFESEGDILVGLQTERMNKSESGAECPLSTCCWVDGVAVTLALSKPRSALNTDREGEGHGVCGWIDGWM